jgi:hypothetical protein
MVHKRQQAQIPYARNYIFLENYIKEIDWCMLKWFSTAQWNGPTYKFVKTEY